MNKFRKLISFLLIGLTLSATGCSTAWWANFKKDPVAQTESILQTVATIVSIATAVFGEVKQALPVDQQAKAQAEFDNGLLAVDATIDAARSLVAVAADAQQSNPDFTKVLNDLSTAVTNLQNVVATYKALIAGTPPAVGIAQNYAVLESRVGALKQRLARPLVAN